MIETNEVIETLERRAKEETTPVSKQNTEKQ